MRNCDREPAGRSRGGVRLFVALPIAFVLSIVLSIWLLWPRHETPSSRLTGASGPPAFPTSADSGDVNGSRSARPRIPDRIPGSQRPGATTETPLEKAELRIDSDIEGAMVFLDRQYVGTAPVTVVGIDPGTHQVNVSAEGYQGQVETLELQPGNRTLLVQFKRVTLDASITVIHRHFFGSCRGRLSATPFGLRYDAVKGDDGFSTALGSIEQFEVDYSKKNLRIKLRGGRAYDFKDPDGSADRLFLFRQDVEIARQQLAEGRLPAGG